jgi:hypothetical protein
MAAKRGRKTHGKKKTHHKTPKVTHAGNGGTLLLHSMKKQLTRIENKVDPDKLARKIAKKRAKIDEESLASKYA